MESVHCLSRKQISVIFYIALITGSYLSLNSSLAQSLRMEWAQTGGGRYLDWAYVTIDSNDNILLGGAITAPARFGGLSLSVPTDNFQDIFIAKLRPDGEPIWLQSSGGSLMDSATSIAANDSGQILVGGFFRDQFTFFGGPLLTSVGDPERDKSRDGFVALFDSDGSFRWIKHGGDELRDTSRGVTFDIAGNGLATGQLRRGGRFDGIPASAQFFGSFFVSSHQVGNGRFNNFRARGLAIGHDIVGMPDGGYVVVGELFGNTDFGNTFPRTPRGESDAFVARYNSSYELQFIYNSG